LNYGASTSGAQNKHFDDNLLFQQALSLQLYNESPIFQWVFLDVAFGQA
jgi:hypothetical protein